jgi:hypothetical protein
MKNGPYEFVIAPPGYPGFKYRGRYIYEHHLVWWRVTGRTVPDGYILHHENEDKRDNRFENLRLMTAQEHSREHNGERKVSPAILRCGTCKQKFEIPKRNLRWKRKIGQRRFYCSRSCQVRGQWKERRVA